jgi:hypothetical protein
VSEADNVNEKRMHKKRKKMIGAAVLMLMKSINYE